MILFSGGSLNAAECLHVIGSKCNSATKLQGLPDVAQVSYSVFRKPIELSVSISIYKADIRLFFFEDHITSV